MFFLLVISFPAKHRLLDYFRTSPTFAVGLCYFVTVPSHPRPSVIPLPSCCYYQSFPPCPCCHHLVLAVITLSSLSSPCPCCHHLVLAVITSSSLASTVITRPSPSSFRYQALIRLPAHNITIDQCIKYITL
jgi:hypothetical protein